MTQQAFIFNQGKHYVLYKDGEKSMCMPRHIAQDYADIFGGTVYRHPDFPTVWQRISNAIAKAQR